MVRMGMGSPRRKWPLVLFCTLIVCGMGYASWAQKAGTAVRERLQLALIALEKHARSPVYRTRPLWGEGSKELAFAQYAQAAAAADAKGLPKSLSWDEAAGSLLEGGKAAAPERAQELREAWASAIEHLRVGAHSTAARPNTIPLLRLRSQSLGTAPTLPAASRDGLDVVLQLELRWLAHEARMADFVRLWMDAFTFTVDCHPERAENSGELPGHALVEVLTDDLLAALCERDLQLLDEFLNTAEPFVAELPDPDTYLVGWALGFVQSRATSESFGRRLYAWRQGFDPHREHIEGFLELLELRSLLKPAAKDGGEREAQWSRYRSARRERQTSASSVLDEISENIERQARQLLARVRLLRLAVAFHRGVELPQLADPFASAPLQVQIEGDAAVLRSAITFPGSQRIARRR
ncbi:MAG: hypothetical protein IT456_01920 [Planctomycetes bacterium]|nr:hypothetical protein [Planctomycetota bacterium]